MRKEYSYPPFDIDVENEYPYSTPHDQQEDTFPVDPQLQIEEITEEYIPPPPMPENVIEILEKQYAIIPYKEHPLAPNVISEIPAGLPNRPTKIYEDYTDIIQ